MGQLEAHGVNEMYLSGMMVGLFHNYVAEGQESATFESFKAYFFSAAFLASTRKNKRVSNAKILVQTPDKGAYTS